MRILISCVLMCLIGTNLSGQLPNGTYAPDFTATDLIGNEYNLYEILNQGKTVILDISATWCSPCWDYHTAGALDELYESHGPNGSDDFFVFLIEGDMDTSIEDLYGTGDNTLGDWTEHTEYPIIDSREIAELYQINFFPTLYMICPNRTVYNLSQGTADEIIADQNICPEIQAGTNVSVLHYDGFEGSFCESIDFNPKLVIQNLGTDVISSVEVSLFLNGIVDSSIIWNGNMPTYEVAEIDFGPLSILEDTELSFELKMLDPQEEVDLSDNNYAAEILVAPNVNNPMLLLELTLDNYPQQIYWEIVGEDNQVLYYGGNGFVIGLDNPEAGYTQQGLVTVPIDLPSSQCYEFRIYDSFGNGLGNTGQYQLVDQNGNQLISNRPFESEDTRPFGVINHDGILNNAAITSIDDFPLDFCGVMVLDHELEVINLGSENIELLSFEFGDQDGIIEGFEWEGVIQPGRKKMIQIPAFTIDKSGMYYFEIIEVNTEIDMYAYRNRVIQIADAKSTTVNKWIIDITTDLYGHELYWQITDDNDEILISGGNEVVGPDGGGLSIATVDDVGAYSNSKHYQEEITLPTNGCYKLLVVDDGGNGFAPGGFGIADPFVRIRNNSVGIITGTDGDFDNAYESNIEVDFFSSSEEVELEGISIFPNPTNDYIYLQSAKGLIEFAKVTMYTVSGELILTKDIASSQRIDMSNLQQGLYFIKISSVKTGQSIIQKIIKE